ncbi:hypothetical protein L1Z56_14390 [Acinetobacter baumannii]|nr:hypothetical protein [Acinetobacter baumannii]MCF4588518.1 hypothetical protein [Acinetobacter baumannii]MCF4626732.1 hypothetical protein [Acinetobacter baumannii]
MMGLVGGYDAHFYCDSCNAFSQGYGQTKAEAIRDIRNRGWVLKRDGLVLCEACKKRKNIAIIPEDDRNGCEWNI